MHIPRQEHPKPQFMRKGYINLNGQWQFEIDNGRSGEARGLQKIGVKLGSTITVPFCPESMLSGVANRDFMNGVWYKRTVDLPRQEGCVRLHFGAVDYACKAFVNGNEVGEHKGGYSSFFFDITAFLQPGENEIALYATDDSRDPLIPSGKQSMLYDSYRCYYTRTTGIWQTVWLELLPQSYVESVRYYPNVTDGAVTVQVQLQGSGDFECEITYEGEKMAAYTKPQAAGMLNFTLPLKEKHLWEVGKGRLYDVKLSFGEDEVSSYFGLREVRMDGYKFLLNGKSVFQRLILDQGFYPDGIYTAPTDGDLVRDIKLSMDLGFNGARLHEKIFEERYLYHADKLGYLVWGEYPDWGMDIGAPENANAVLPEWLEAVQRDFNHPAIIGWCPHNETWERFGHKQCDVTVAMIYDATKAVDPTRPCIDTSGHYHVKTDIFDVHDYEQDPAVFRSHYEGLEKGETVFDRHADRQTYTGGPFFVSEYGGIRWAEGENDEKRLKSWGYGKDVPDMEAFYTRYQGLTDVLLDNPKMFGLCYTQLTDVEQEQNGLYTYDRRAKFDAKRLCAIMSRKAAIED
ncbi:MAG: beta-galactosidase [Oscillospiraceae bacterium]|nr:beta-galactosidase [Oscillospiraceae bacterium]